LLVRIFLALKMPIRINNRDNWDIKLFILARYITAPGGEDKYCKIQMQEDIH
jgi:hypothetical protein